MNYTVIWEAVAERKLMTIWVDAEDRAAVAFAADEIDRLLGTNPELRGESRSGMTRIVLVEPLGALFDIRESDRIVAVLKLWYYARRPLS